MTNDPKQRPYEEGRRRFVQPAGSIEIMSDPSRGDDTPVGATAPDSLGRVVARLSAYLDADRRGAGALAELRRIAEDDLPAAFWHLYLQEVPEEWREPDRHVVEKIDRAWAALIRSMVEMAPQPHAFDQPFGVALAATQYSEPRFVRLLRARGSDLMRELRVAGAWLARAGVKANWEQPAHLLLGGMSPRWTRQRWTRPDGVRHRMARDYFREAAKRQSNQ